LIKIQWSSKKFIICLFLAIIVLAVYYQTGDYQFISVDDDKYVTENPHVRRGLTLEGACWAFTGMDAANWHPLSWLSHMADVSLFGMDAGWHHRMSVLIHGCNVLLLFFALSGMTGSTWRSGFVAALFAVHPLHVESVAWVAERKDVLSTLFWMLTMISYWRYTVRGGVARYLLALVLFALGLMTKPMLVTLPFVLLLMDYWPLCRLEAAKTGNSWISAKSLLWEKTPFFLMSLASSVITYTAQHGGGAVSSLDHYTLWVRAGNAAISYVSYLLKMLWPASLAIFYPHPVTIGRGVPAWQVAGAVVLLVGISFLVWRARHQRPYVAVGWLWYLGTLVPVIGLVQVGEQAMADRYTYIPLIGPFLILSWGIPEFIKGRGLHRMVAGVLGVSVTLALTGAAWIQTGYWRNDFTLFSHALRVTEDNWVAWNGLGVAYRDLGQVPQAIEAFQEALRLRPDFAVAWNNLGVASGIAGQIPQAINALQKALLLKPDIVEAWNNLGTAYARTGKFPQAIEAYKEAIRLNPDLVEAWYNLGVSYFMAGRQEQISEVYQPLSRLDPNAAERLYQKTGGRRNGSMPTGRRLETR